MNDAHVENRFQQKIDDEIRIEPKDWMPENTGKHLFAR